MRMCNRLVIHRLRCQGALQLSIQSATYLGAQLLLHRCPRFRKLSARLIAESITSTPVAANN